MVYCGLIASPAMQQISSNPRYPKKEDVAPRATPLTPKGMNGLKLDGRMKKNPVMAMNDTTPTLAMVKKFVTLLLSFTPFNNNNTANMAIKAAIRLKVDLLPSLLICPAKRKG